MHEPQLGWQAGTEVLVHGQQSLLNLHVLRFGLQLQLG